MEALIDILKSEKKAIPDRFGFTQLFRLAHDIKFSYDSDEIEDIYKQFASLDFEKIDADDISNLSAFLIECLSFKKEFDVSKILKKWYLKLDNIDKKSELFVILSRLSKGLNSNELIDKNALIIKEKNILLWIEGTINSKWFSVLPNETIDEIGKGFCLLLNQNDFDSEFLTYMSLLSKNVNDKNDIEKFYRIISFCLNFCTKKSSVEKIKNWLNKKGISLPRKMVTERNRSTSGFQLEGYADLAISKVKIVATIFEYSPN